MRRKPVRDSDATNRLFFETLEPRELLAADTGADWWSSWDVAAEDEWAWTADDSWAAETGGDAFWDGGFWDGGSWDDAWWVDDSAWQTTDEGALDSGAYDWGIVADDDDTTTDATTATLDPWHADPVPLPDESTIPPVVDDAMVSDDAAVPTDSEGSPTDESIDASTVSGDADPVDPVSTDSSVVEDLVAGDVVVEEIVPPEEIPGDDSAIDVTGVDNVALHHDVTSAGDDAAVETRSPDDLFDGADELEFTAVPDEAVPYEIILDEVIPDGVGPEEADPGVAMTGDDTTTTTDDAIPIRSVAVATPDAVASGSPKTGTVRGGSGRGELFRAWGAFFFPGFGQSMHAADGLAAGPQSEATAPAARPRSRLPVRPVR